MATAETQKKNNRLSRLLGKRDKSPESPATFPPDSAYASSEKSAEQIVPIEKNSDLGGIDRDKNLGVKPSTGEILDRDTGEVVTVVTTTTTTTTTTTRKPGQKSPPTVQKDVQESTQTQPAIHNSNGIPITDSNTSPSGIVAEMPATPAGTGPTPPPGPAAIEPARTHDASLAHNPSMARKPSPGIPARSANRRSGEYNNFNSSGADVSPVEPTSYFARPGPTGNTPPLSPTRPSNSNFSYPSRGRDSLDGASNFTTTTQPQNHNRSTMSDLRAAAKGIHGVGETLRGTLNNTLDENFPRKNAKKQAKATAKNDAVLARGREEVGGIPIHHSRSQRPDPDDMTYTSSARPPPIPAQRDYAGHGVQGGGQGVHQGPRTAMTQAAVPQQQQQQQKPPSPRRTPTAEQVVPGSWGADGEGYDDDGSGIGGGQGVVTGQENSGVGKEKRGIGKLFKRKPVAGGGQGGGAEGGELRDRKYY